MKKKKDDPHTKTLNDTIVNRLTPFQTDKPPSDPPNSEVFHDPELAKAIMSLSSAATDGIERADVREEQSMKRFWGFSGFVGICTFAVLVSVVRLHSFVAPVVPAIEKLTESLEDWKVKAEAADLRSKNAEEDLQGAIVTIQELASSVSSLIASQTASDSNERKEHAKDAQASALRTEAKAVKAQQIVLRRKGKSEPPKLKARAARLRKRAKNSHVVLD